MSSFIESRQRAIALIEKLSQDKLPAVVQILELLADQSSQSQPHTQESELIATIHQKLPEAEQKELDRLRKLAQANQISDAEHQALIDLEDKQEQLRARHLSALIELANLRNTDLITLNRELQSNINAA